jgi:acyl carrier protein
MKVMNNNEIKFAIKNIIINCLNLSISPDQIAGDDLINELGINSIDALEIFLNIENKFQFQIPDEDLNASLLGNVEELSNYISKKMKETRNMESDS